MKYPDKTILTVMMQWNYCDPKRGYTGDKLIFFNNLQQMVRHVESFWFDDYIANKELLQKELLKKAEEIKPDLIFFIPYTDQFTFETLDALKAKYPTYAWFGDDHWRFDLFPKYYAPHFTYVSTTDPYCISKYNKIGISPILSQWAAQPFSDDIGLLNVHEAYEFDISFVGANSKYRTWLIGWLEKQGINVECFGFGWPNGIVSFERMEQIFRKSRINLNVSNSANSDVRFVCSSPRNFLHYLRSPKRYEQIKARNFEIPMAGGFQLSCYVPGLERYLTIGEEIAIYTTPEECLQQIKYYDLHEGERQALVTRSYDRCKNEHTYRHRLEHILGEIWA